MGNAEHKIMEYQTECLRSTTFLWDPQKKGR